MTKLQTISKQSRTTRADALFIRADSLEDRGNLRAAFRLFLAAAKAGDSGCQLNVGNYYDDAKGIRRNRGAALYWYRRAYQRGVAAAAYNIAIVWRNEGKPKRALSWFRRAVKMGDDEANLEIAKYYLANVNNPRKAIPHLARVCRSSGISQAGAEEAAHLLKQARKKLTRSCEGIIRQQRRR